MKKALITGITGQDGSYLAELLLAKDYEVHGMIRRASTFNTDRIDHLYQDPHEEGVRLFLHYGDLTDGSQLARLIRKVRPDEIYNLAAQTHVQVSFDQPEYTGDVAGLGVTRLLPSPRSPRSVPARPTRWPSCTRTGSCGTTGRPTACSPCRGSSSTTRE